MKAVVSLSLLAVCFANKETVKVSDPFPPGFVGPMIFEKTESTEEPITFMPGPVILPGEEPTNGGETPVIVGEPNFDGPLKFGFGPMVFAKTDKTEEPITFMPGPVILPGEEPTNGGETPVIVGEPNFDGPLKFGFGPMVFAKADKTEEPITFMPGPVILPGEEPTNGGETPVIVGEPNFDGPLKFGFGPMVFAKADKTEEPITFMPGPVILPGEEPTNGGETPIIVGEPNFDGPLKFGFGPMIFEKTAETEEPITFMPGPVILPGEEPTNGGETPVIVGEPNFDGPLKFGFGPMVFAKADKTEEPITFMPGPVILPGEEPTNGGETPIIVGEPNFDDPLKFGFGPMTFAKTDKTEEPNFLGF